MPDKTPAKMNKFLPILLMIWPYLYIPLLSTLDTSNEVIKKFFEVTYISVTAVIYVTNIVYAISFSILHKEADACKQLAFWNMLIKLVHIPFYLLIFVAGVFMVFIMVIPVFILISPFIILVFVLVDIFLMITSSMYGLCALIRSAKAEILSKKCAIICGIFNFCFVTDIISAIVIFVKIRKKMKEGGFT